MSMPVSKNHLTAKYMFRHTFTTAVSIRYQSTHTYRMDYQRKMNYYIDMHLRLVRVSWSRTAGESMLQ